MTDYIRTDDGGYITSIEPKKPLTIEEKLKRVNSILRNESYFVAVKDGGQTQIRANIPNDRTEALAMLASLNKIVRLITDKHPTLK